MSRLTHIDATAGNGRTLSLDKRSGMMQGRNGKQFRQAMGGGAAIAGIGAGLFSYAFLHEPMRIRLDRLTFRLPNAKGRIPATGLRILHLSDTHFRGANWRERPKMADIRRMCANMQYDILVHTGDFLHNDGGLENTLALLDALPKPRLASYAVFGNHDYTTYSAKEMFGRSWVNFKRMELERGCNGRRRPAQQVSRLLEFASYFLNAPLDLRRTGHNDTQKLGRELTSRGFHILHNRHERLETILDNREGVDLYFAGVDDLTEGAPDLLTALFDVPVEAPTILLSHNPDIVGEQGIEQADLVLSGHTHGGQIVLPWLGPAHTHTAHLTRREASGYLRRGATQIYITRGIGEGIPLRFAAAPQIALLTVLP